MIAGVDPFNDEDPMLVYQKILKGKLKFPSSFDSNAKSLVKHILVQDLSKRYGNLKNGVNDIKEHRFFKNLNWNDLLLGKIQPIYKPKVSSGSDVGNFNTYDEDEEDMNAPSIKKDEDPFIDW
ncbi:MAG: hypothetical protein MJ252_18250 [archaeon]|nr:hypothetical protein [archaeon]